MKNSDFHKRFPDEDSCRKFLFDMKWSDGYRCKKCGYHKGSIKDDYSYKCNKCYHTESVTAHTFLHNVRFGIDKAFYIINEVIEEAGSVKAAYISHAYGISNVTAWKFLKRIPNLKLDMVLNYKVK